MCRVDINDLTLAQIREIAALVAPSPTHSGDSSAWEIGASYLIRTVTMTNTGRLVAVTNQELVLEDAAWIADTGRWANAVVTNDFSEVEPFPAGARVIVGRGAIVDAVKITTLPRKQK